MKRLLLEGRVEVDGPGGGAILVANGSSVRVDFPTVKAAISAWRAVRRSTLSLPFASTGLRVEVYVRGIRVRRLGTST